MSKEKCKHAAIESLCDWCDEDNRKASRDSRCFRCIHDPGPRTCGFRLKEPYAEAVE